MQYMGPVRVSDVEAAQQKIVDIVRRLEDAGEIIIAGRGGEKEWSSNSQSRGVSPRLSEEKRASGESMGLIKAADAPISVAAFSMQDIEAAARNVILRAQRKAEQSPPRQKRRGRKSNRVPASKALPKAAVSASHREPTKEKNPATRRHWPSTPRP